MQWYCVYLSSIIPLLFINAGPTSAILLCTTEGKLLNWPHKNSKVSGLYVAYVYVCVCLSYPPFYITIIMRLVIYGAIYSESVCFAPDTVVEYEVYAFCKPGSLVSQLTFMRVSEKCMFIISLSMKGLVGLHKLKLRTRNLYRR